MRVKSFLHADLPLECSRARVKSFLHADIALHPLRARANHSAGLCVVGTNALVAAGAVPPH